jgi:ArsR family transcriptional regulator, arsenate/arsenite/antimonite-responsive transcriptional repressor
MTEAEIQPCCRPVIRADVSVEDCELAAAVFKALGDPVRVQLLALIGSAESGEACACDLVEPSQRSQATVSHHLSQLTKAGLIMREQRGKWAWYRVNRSQLESVCEALVF